MVTLTTDTTEPDTIVRVAPTVYEAVDAKTAVLAALIAYQLGLLTQQGPCPTPATRDPLGRPDAIGVSLLNPVALPTSDRPDVIRRMQQASDAWARDPSNSYREREFVALLNDLIEELS